jgi:transposase
MSSSTLLPCLEGIAIESIASTHNSIVLRLTTVAPYVACPLCGVHSGRVHSRYERTLADLPWNRVAVRIHLRSRKLFCGNPACERSIFTEPLPELAARYARKTLRLQEAFYIIGYALGGKAGARVALGLGLTTSPDTLLRRVRQVATKNTASSTGLRVVGVDDWAFKKGHRYGTLLVDLQTHRLLELLPDRSSESLAHWLKKHPGIEVVSRDRAQVYAEGTREGAPQAEHVADRWHLLHNLGEAIERLTAQHATHLRQAVKRMQPTTPEVPSAEETPPVRLPRFEQRRLERCAEREALYNRIKQLRQQGRTIQVIATETGVSKRTVLRFLRAEQFPARARRRRQPRNTDPFLPYLQQRMEQGCLNAAQLYRDVKAQGYSGSYGCIYNALQRIAPKQTEPQKARSPAGSHAEVPSSRTVAWWLQGHFHIAKPEVSEEQKAFLAHLYTLAPVLQEAAELAQEFARIVKNRQSADLQAWLEKARQSACREIQLFAQGLRQDLAAVQNAVALEWSNGQVEGQVNRLKMLKRQMYGRANFDLLRARVLPMAQAA